MSNGMPSPAQERWISLARRYPGLQDLARSPDRDGGWHTASPRGRFGFFVLAQLAAFFGSLFLAPLIESAGFSLRGFWLLTGLIALVAAEWVVRQRQAFKSGLEEGLWTSGIAALCLYVADSLASHSVAAAATVCGGLLFIAALRMLSPLAMTLAMIAFVTGLQASVDASRRSLTFAFVLFLVCVAIALLSLVLGARRFERPSHDRMLDQLVVVMPVFAYLPLGSLPYLAKLPIGMELDLSGLPATMLGVRLVLLGCAGLFLWTGLRRRTHAPIIAALLCVLCLVVDLHAVIGLSLRWQLVLWGSVALAASVVLDRWLRKPRNGITTADVGDDAESPIFPDIARAALLTPLHAPASSTPYEGGSGGFSGGGASGRY